MKRVHRVVFLVAAALVAAHPARAVRVGLFADPAGTACSLQVPTNSSGILYLLAIVDEPPADRLKGFELRITGIPSAWTPSFAPSVAPDPFVATLGNVVQGGGLVAFPTCRAAVGRIVELGTVSFVNTDGSTHVVVRVEASTTPSNAAFPDPLIVLCDTANECVPNSPLPVYTKVRVRGLEAEVNGNSCVVDSPVEMVQGGHLSVWPNPARGTSTIQYSLSRAGLVHLEIFDLAGRRVRRLPVEAALPGTRSISWDGRDDAGHVVAQGVYFIQLDERGVRSRRRLTLLH